MLILKVHDDQVTDFAAEELKKYLRMMMPEGGNPEIRRGKTDEGSGIRLGLLSDFGMDASEAGDPMLDDVLHIDITNSCGIIAGSNPRSILQAVYKFLNENGCEWLFPGVDGEFVPIIEKLKDVHIHFVPDCRFRGQCNEGSESQQCMLDTIDYSPKIGLNTYMLEFFNPFVYYTRYYNHLGNPSWKPEPVNYDTVLQWKRQCEAEFEKRGLMFHDMGHGWTAEPFGISSVRGWDTVDQEIPEDTRQYLAEVNGVRGLYGNIALNTNICMSNPTARKKVADAVIAYAGKHQNVDYLHIWLGDGNNNHCECSECVKKLPSDWYVMMMNEVDDALTAAGLSTRIVFIDYQETMWAPETEKLNHPERFTLMMAPIHRTYGEPLKKTEGEFRPIPFVRNHVVFPSDFAETFRYHDLWKKAAPCPGFAYEYHFFYGPCRDLTGLRMAEIVHEDVRMYKEHDIDGIIEDGSQRCYFPNGFEMFTYAKTLNRTDVDYEELRTHYYKTAYGQDWEQAAGLLEKVKTEIPFAYFSGYLGSKEEGADPYYAPQLAPQFQQAQKTARQIRRFAETHREMPYRVQSVCMKLLYYFAEYVTGMAKCCEKRCIGDTKASAELYHSFYTRFGKHEPEIQANFDQGLVSELQSRIFDPEHAW